MVSYQAWVSICFEALQERGVQIDDVDDGASIMKFAGDVWQREGHRIDRMSEGEARQMVMFAAENY